MKKIICSLVELIFGGCTAFCVLGILACFTSGEIEAGFVAAICAAIMAIPTYIAYKIKDNMKLPTELQDKIKNKADKKEAKTEVKQYKKKERELKRIERTILYEISEENKKRDKRNFETYCNSTEGNNEILKIENFINESKDILEGIKLSCYQHGIMADIDTGYFRIGTSRNIKWSNINLVNITKQEVKLSDSYSHTSNNRKYVDRPGFFVNSVTHVDGGSTTVFHDAEYGFKYTIKIDYNSIVLVTPDNYDIETIKNLLLKLREHESLRKEYLDFKRNKKDIINKRYNEYKLSHKDLFEETIVLSKEQLNNEVMRRYNNER